MQQLVAVDESGQLFEVADADTQLRLHFGNAVLALDLGHAGVVHCQHQTLFQVLDFGLHARSLRLGSSLDLVDLLLEFEDTVGGFDEIECHGISS